MDEKLNVRAPTSNAKTKKKKKLRALKVKALLNDSEDKKKKKSKQKKKNILDNKVNQKMPKKSNDDDDSDNEICEFSDGEEADDMELKNDIDKFIQNLHFERFSDTFYDSDEESDSGTKSPKKKKLKSSKNSQSESENQVEKKSESKLSNPKKSIENCEDKNFKEESKKSKKREKMKQIQKNEEQMELDHKSAKLEPVQNKKNKNKKTPLKSDKDSESNVETKSVNTESESTKKTAKKDKNLPKESSPTKSGNLIIKDNAVEKKNEILEKLKKQLQSASFRLINEQLYTSTGNDAFQMFKEDPNSFKVYHEGYSKQVSEWPVNPLNLIISWLRKKPRTWTVADFGCGKAILSKSVKQKVLSIDLISSAPNVIKCNMAHTPLESNSVNVAVFCLSLMGTNLTEFIVEANRVLVDRGILKIAEIESRFEKDVNQFLKVMMLLGFKNIHKNQNQNYFWLFDFIKVQSVKLKSKLPELKLKACIYKKR